MYRCYFCGKNSQPCEKANFVVLIRRHKIYPFRPGVNRVKDLEENKWKFVPDEGGEGFETVKEVIACKECAKIPHKITMLPS